MAVRDVGGDVNRGDCGYRSLGVVLLLFVSACGGGSNGGDDAPLGPQLDQELDTSALCSAEMFDGVHRAQTFTVGVTGDLTRVDLKLHMGDDGPLTFEIRPAPGGAPAEDDGSVLETITLPSTSVLSTLPDWFTFDLSASPLAVNEGDVLAIVLWTSASSAWWQCSGSDPGAPQYADGKGWWRSVATFQEASSDHAFRTWVVPGP